MADIANTLFFFKISGNKNVKVGNILAKWDYVDK